MARVLNSSTLRYEDIEDRAMSASGNITQEAENLSWVLKVLGCGMVGDNTGRIGRDGENLPQTWSCTGA